MIDAERLLQCHVGGLPAKLSCAPILGLSNWYECVNGTGFVGASTVYCTFLSYPIHTIWI